MILTHDFLLILNVKVKELTSQEIDLLELVMKLMKQYLFRIVSMSLYQSLRDHSRFLNHESKYAHFEIHEPKLRSFDFVYRVVSSIRESERLKLTSIIGILIH